MAAIDTNSEFSLSLVGCADDGTGVDALNAVTIASATLSVFGSLFIIFTYHQIVTMRSTGMRTVYWLSVCDLFASLTFIIDGASDSSCRAGTFCALKAASSQFFGLAAILWTGSIALNLDLSVLRRSRLSQDTPRFMRRLHQGVWGASAAVAGGLALGGVLGPAGGGWCWIVRSAPWGRMLLFYLPLVAIIGYNLLIYARTRATLQMLHREASRSAAELEVAPPQSSTVGGLTSRLRSFLLVFGLIHAAQIINRLHDLFYPMSPSFQLSMLHALLGPLQGFGNACVYGYTPRVRRHWADRCPRLCAALRLTPPPEEGAGAPASPGGSGMQLQNHAEVAPAGGLVEGVPARGVV